MIENWHLHFHVYIGKANHMISAHNIHMNHACESHMIFSNQIHMIVDLTKHMIAHVHVRMVIHLKIIWFVTKNVHTNSCFCNDMNLQAHFI